MSKSEIAMLSLSKTSQGTGVPHFDVNEKLESSKNCPAPVAPDSGSVTFSGVRPNDGVTYQCDHGYIMAGRSEFKCLVSGEWEALPPYCEPTNCGHPGSPDNGYISGRVFSYGSRVRFVCNRGFELDGPESLYCDKYGEWDDDIPDCVEIQCQVPILSANTISSVSSRLVSPGTLVTFSCTPGNKLLSTHDSSRCQIDGTFDKSIPTCDPERCPTPPIIDFGEPKELKPDYGVGETVQYQCLYGYRFSPDSGNRRGSINCLPSGTWEDDLPECEEILCPDPPLAQNAEAVGDERYVDAEVTYQCKAGYESVGRNAIRCLDTQVWTRLRMRCRPVQCGEPPQIPFGSFTGDQYVFESSVQYQCDLGYELKGNGQLTCGSDTAWQGGNPTCEPISCGPPSNNDNGRASYDGFAFGDTAVYSCSPGYVTSGSSRLTCESNGLWTPDVPVCRPQTCPVPPDVVNAVYEAPSDLVFNSNVRYRCNVGHRMSGSPDLVCNERAEWTPEPPVCEKITCPKPTAPDSGSVRVKDLSYASIVSYSCDGNSRLIGVDGRSCQADGTWSDEMPTCQATTCQPGQLDNGQVNYKDLSIGSIVTYSCDKGYLLAGDSIRRCQVDLTLGGVAPVCTPVDCGSLAPILNGNIVYSTSNTLFGTTATFECDTGYFVDGADNIYCRSDGRWSGAVSECRAVSCPKVSKVIPNGRVVGSSFDYASVLTYECSDGYTLAGTGQRTCQADGNWDNPVPSCVIITCPTLRIAFGFLSTLSNTVDTTVKYTCQQSYALEGPEERSCLPDGSWSGSDPKCLRIRCNAPPQVEHARSAVLNETAIEYTCVKGFDLVGVRVRVCERDDIWTPDAPVCLPAFCEDLSSEIVENGQILFTSAKVGQIVEYLCNPGYKIKGDERRRCLKSGLWEGENPICEIIDCGHPGVVQNGYVEGTDYTYGASVRFLCDEGYIQNGADSIRCEESGYWENLYPNCERVRCSDLPSRIQNGRVYYDSTAYLSIVEYVCRKGFILQGVRERQCTDTGDWSEAEPTCIPIVCPTPETVEHGILIGGKESYGYGDEITYDCEIGHYMHGKPSRRCTKDATWTKWIPKCYNVQCPEPPPIENGDFIGNSAKYQSVLTFFCFEGYRLIGDAEVTCGADGQWSGSGSTTCERVTCESPPIIDNANPDQTTYLSYDTLIQYTCIEGFTPNGNDLTKCLANATWSYINFSCTIISCPSISASDIPHGLFETTSFNYGGSVTFTCDDGYRLYGDNVLQCQASGSWSSTLPRCNIVECPVLVTVDNGLVASDSREYGSSASVFCNVGYTLQGSPSITCLSSALWSDSLPSCQIIACPYPPVLDNGQILNPDEPHVFNSKFEYACGFGYELQGVNVLRCTEFGAYDNPAPRCKRIPCPEIEGITFGEYRRLNETFVSYQCSSGFILEGAAIRECVLGGEWSSPAPLCQPVPCPPPPGIDNGNVIGSKFTFGEFVEYRCITGYNLIGSPISVCQVDGTWGDQKTQCLPVNCKEPEGSFPNGHIIGDTYTYLHTIEYVCSSGFQLEGHNIRTCHEDGEWSHQIPTCLRLNCEKPEPIANGAFFGNSYLFESMISYNCSEGYTLSGENTRTCENTLLWSGENPFCARVSCLPPDDVLNGFIDGSSYLYEAVVEISCNRGYRLEGSQSRTCQADKSWSGVDSVCTKILCPVPPPALLNGFSDYEVGNVYGVDDTLTYFCAKGYSMDGTGQRSCASTGQWSTNVLQCFAVLCPDVDEIRNGFYNSDFPESPFTYPSSLAFSCNEGFSLVGSSTADCRSSGTWSETIPTCSIIECQPLVIENGITQLLPDNVLNAYFDREHGKLYAGDSVLIQCNIGYEIKGISSTSCSLSGRWKSGFGSCQRVQCPAPGIENGIVSGVSFLYTDQIQISCNRGYRLEGSESRTCQEDRSWSGAEAVCTKIYCPVPPPALVNGFSDYKLGNIYSVDDTVVYFCAEGYRMDGSGERLCESSGHWSANAFQCYAVSCPDVSEIINGFYNSDSPNNPFTYPSSLAFSCNEGFSLVGSLTADCRSTGTWSEAIPTCSIIECQPLVIENGITQLLPDNVLNAYFDREHGKLYAGDSVLIQCNIGYEIKGISSTSCSLSGRWKSGFGSCQRVQCPAPAIENGMVSGVSFFYTDQIQISCNRGYRLEGSESRTCQEDRSWSGAESVCTKIYCPVPPPELQNSVNGYKLESVYGVDDTLSYECIEGHIMNGTGQRMCELNGEWSTNFQHCYAISCPVVSTFTNGRFNSDLPQNPFTFPSSLQFSCDLGFRLEGGSRIRCGPNGKWSEEISRCAIIECGTLELENGHLELLLDGGLGTADVRESGQFYAGDRVSIQCDTGYEIHGETNAICSMEGVWSTESYCSPVTCEAPDIKGAIFSDDSENFNYKIRVSCDDGLDLIGSDELTCGFDTNWVESLPRCEVLACGSPPKVSNAVLKGESFNLGDVVNYECKAGYDLVGNSLLTCGPNNIWLGSYPVCVRVDCGQPVLPDAYVEADSTKFQSSATIHCFDGYVLYGGRFITCGADRQWIYDTSGVCLPVDCGNPPNIPNGSVFSDQTTFESLAVYTCDAGHVMEGTSSMYCSAHGQWGYEVPLCSPVRCLSDIANVAHATYTKTGSFYRDVVQFECDKGYQFQNPSANTLSCGDMGIWNGDISNCIVIDCGQPPQFNNAFSSFKLTTYSSIVSFDCIPGYETNATKVFPCSDGGIWEGDEIQCVKKDCLDYPELINGDYSLGNGTLYEAEVFYSCVTGYEKTGPGYIKCTSDGKWTSPYCAAVDCMDPPQVEHGHYQVGSTMYESEVKYQCDAGYVLAGKSTIECLDTGVWTPTQALCKPLNCREPPSIDNADVRVNTTLYQGIATYSCDIGFTPQAPMSLSCDDTGNWNGIVPNCEQIECDPPTAPEYGYVDFKGLAYSSIAQYGCNAGYTLIGQNRRTCQVNGTWSYEVPKCSALDCTEPENIANGKVTISGLGFGGRAYFSCLEGYILEGHPSIVCDENGFWNSSVPKCNIIDCRNPPLLAHGQVQYEGTTFLSKATYTCTKGYSLIGSRESTCQVEGQWLLDEKRECKQITCPSPPPLENGALISYNETFGSRAIYRCLPEYKPQTLIILTCDESSSWYGNLPSCSLKLCPEPNAIDNGGYQYPGRLSVGTVVSYFCETGYNLVGSSTMRCTNDEFWSSQPPYCKPVTCPPLTSVPFSILTQEDEARFMSIATFQCQDGYRMTNQNDPESIEAVYICDPNGQWEGDGFACDSITCPFYPPLIDNAIFELTNGNVYGSKAIYKCEIGYVMSGQNNVACEKTGEWGPLPLPVCNVVSCALPPDVEGATYSDISLTYGSVVTYSCYKDRNMMGDSSIHCQPDGFWSPITFSCDSVTCKSLAVPDNGKILNAFEDVFVAGSTVNFACNDGYTLVGAGTVSCLQGGLWDLPASWCKKVIGVCEESIAMPKAVRPPPGRFPGDEILVGCVDGYVGAGDMFATCQDDGSWRIPPGQCRRVSCGRPDSYDRRNVRVFGRSFLYEDKVRYMCRYGFSPVHNPPVLQCLSSGQWDNKASCIAQCKQKCDNGGRCLGLNRCKCMPGWAGFKCHLPICIFPCLNGGQCVGPYQCKCQHGYQGSRCERAVCPRQCQNGGRCSRPGKCSCLSGFQGPACEDHVLASRGTHTTYVLQ